MQHPYFQGKDAPKEHKKRCEICHDKCGYYCTICSGRTLSEIQAFHNPSPKSKRQRTCYQQHCEVLVEDNQDNDDSDDEDEESFDHELIDEDEDGLIY